MTNPDLVLCSQRTELQADGRWVGWVSKNGEANNRSSPACSRFTGDFYENWKS